MCGFANYILTAKLLSLGDLDVHCNVSVGVGRTKPFGCPCLSLLY